MRINYSSNLYKIIFTYNLYSTIVRLKPYSSNDMQNTELPFTFYYSEIKIQGNIITVLEQNLHSNIVILIQYLSSRFIVVFSICNLI